MGGVDGTGLICPSAPITESSGSAWDLMVISASQLSGRTRTEGCSRTSPCKPEGRRAQTVDQILSKHAGISVPRCGLAWKILATEAFETTENARSNARLPVG